MFDAVIYKDIKKSEKDRKIVVGNSRYSFTLTQASGKDEYVLVDYAKAESSVGARVGAKIVNSRDYAFNDLFFLNQSVNKHKDRVLKCFYVDKQSLAVAVFDSYSDIDHKFIDEVTIFCKPDKNWQIQKVIRKNPKSITTEELFYDKSSREFSYPNKVIFTKVYTENSDEVASKSVATISNSKKSSLSDKTFTLSHYGLPEPDSEANSLFYLYLTGIFCLLGGSLVVFKFVFKKWRTKS